jgi:hypothetical protein
LLSTSQLSMSVVFLPMVPTLSISHAPLDSNFPVEFAVLQVVRLQTLKRRIAQLVVLQVLTGLKMPACLSRILPERLEMFRLPQIMSAILYHKFKTYLHFVQIQAKASSLLLL